MTILPVTIYAMNAQPKVARDNRLMPAAIRPATMLMNRNLAIMEFALRDTRNGVRFGSRSGKDVDHIRLGAPAG